MATRTLSACFGASPYVRALSAAEVLPRRSHGRQRVTDARREGTAPPVQPGLTRPAKGAGSDHPPRRRPVEPDFRLERGLSGSTEARRSKPARPRLHRGAGRGVIPAFDSME